jgi:hypothetical protein
MTFSQKIGLVSCVLLLVSLFLNWTWYPDIEKYFTAFFTENNYYGKPGKALAFFAVTGIGCYAYSKPWTQRLNLIFGGLCTAYGIKTYLLFSSGYDGYVPEPQWGIYLMLAACFGHIFAAAASMAVIKRPADIQPETTREKNQIA